jgi:hypothetical protein
MDKETPPASEEPVLNVQARIHAGSAVLKQTWKRFRNIEKRTRGNNTANAVEVVAALDAARDVLNKCDVAMQQAGVVSEKLLLSAATKVNAVTTAMRMAGTQPVPQEKMVSPSSTSPSSPVDEGMSTSADEGASTLGDQGHHKRTVQLPLWALDVVIMLEHSKAMATAVSQALPELCTPTYFSMHLRDLSRGQQSRITEEIYRFVDGEQGDREEQSDAYQHRSQERPVSERRPVYTSPSSLDQSISERSRSPTPMSLEAEKFKQTLCQQKADDKAHAWSFEEPEQPDKERVLPRANHEREVTKDGQGGRRMVRQALASWKQCPQLDRKPLETHIRALAPLCHQEKSCRA